MSTDLEAASRLASIRDVIEHEGDALARLEDDRLLAVVAEIEELKRAVSNALLLVEKPSQTSTN